MSSSTYLITASGPDRPGMVAQLTREVFSLKGNIEDTSMTRLGGEFVMMLVLSLPNAQATERLLRDVPTLQKLGLSVSLKPLSTRSSKSRAAEPTHMISIYG